MTVKKTEAERSKDLGEAEPYRTERRIGKEDTITLNRGIFLGVFRYFMNIIQHCFICRPSDSTVSADAGFESRAIAKLALAARRSNH